MSIISEFESISKEIFKKDYNSLSNYERQIVMTVFGLNEVVNHTDYLLFKQDNIFETKKQ